MSETSVRPLHMDADIDDSIYPAAGARGKPIITLSGNNPTVHSGSRGKWREVSATG